MTRLPLVEIEITRRSLPDQRAEQLAVEFRTTRSLLGPPAMAMPAMAWAWLGFGLAPFAAWQALVNWMLTAGGVTRVPAVDRQVPPEVPAPAAAIGNNVHPFPSRGRPVL